MTNKIQKKYCFCFVAQAGIIEIQALLLATSLRLYANCSYHLLAGVPQGELQEGTKEIFKELQVIIIPIANPIKGYPIGNKFNIFTKVVQSVQAHYYVYLDSDILCQSSFDGIEGIELYDISLRLAGRPQYYKNAKDWQILYELFDLPTPGKTCLSVRTKERMLPYFNAGFIALNNSKRFPGVWLDTAQYLLDRVDLRKNALHFLDQIALPIAIQRLNLRYHCISNRYNSLPREEQGVIFHHYHSFKNLLAGTGGKQTVIQLLQQYPQISSVIKNILTQHSGLNDLELFKSILKFNG